jgi:hypothetical protein
VVLLSYRYWQKNFGGDRKIVGSTFTMNDKIHTVVGVLPPLPAYPDDNDIWMPAGAARVEDRSGAGAAHPMRRGDSHSATSYWT